MPISSIALRGEGPTTARTVGIAVGFLGVMVWCWGPWSGVGSGVALAQRRDRHPRHRDHSGAHPRGTRLTPADSGETDDEGAFALCVLSPPETCDPCGIRPPTFLDLAATKVRGGTEGPPRMVKVHAQGD